MRLVTRGDLDGVAAAVLITSVENIETIELIHPQDITDNKFEIADNDIMANLPFHPKAAMWFDHHELTESNLKPPQGYRGKHAIAPSVSRVIYEYYSSDKLKKFEYLVKETDRFDSAQLTIDDITDPKDFILLGFTIDSRTGIGRFKDYFKNIVEWLKTMPIEKVLEQPEVRERIRVMRENNEQFLSSLKSHSKQDGNVIFSDYRSAERIPIGNRFLIYTLFPEANVSLRVQWGPGKEFVALTIGHSIFNRTCKTHCGKLCSDYGGGGHKGAAACPLKPDRAEEQLAEIIARLKENG